MEKHRSRDPSSKERYYLACGDWRDDQNLGGILDPPGDDA